MEVQHRERGSERSNREKVRLVSVKPHLLRHASIEDIGRPHPLHLV
jgi:hypothetical protein